MARQDAREARAAVEAKIKSNLVSKLTHYTQFDIDKMIDDHKRKLLVLSGARAGQSVLEGSKSKERES